jgi:hypothetical protein
MLMVQEYRIPRIIHGVTSLVTVAEMLQHGHIFHDVQMAVQALACH